MTTGKRAPRAGKTTMTRKNDGAEFRVYGALRPMPGRKIGWDLERGRYVVLEDGSTERCTSELAIGLFVSAASCGAIERRREICEIACECFMAAQLNAMDGKRGRPKGSKAKNDPEQPAVDRAALAKGPFAGARKAVDEGLVGDLKTERERTLAIRRIGNKAKRSRS
jgi:hypothetical protein